MSILIVIAWIVGGVIIGAGIAIVLYILGFGIEFINCACNIITCNCDGGDALPQMWENGAFGSVITFCMICGAVLGMIYGIIKAKMKKDEEIAKRNAEIAEEERKQRVEWANEIKKKALDVNNICNKNKSQNKPLVHTSYKAEAQMKEIMNELTKVAEIQGKIDSIAEELSKKEG